MIFCIIRCTLCENNYPVINHIEYLDVNDNVLIDSQSTCSSLIITDTPYRIIRDHCMHYCDVIAIRKCPFSIVKSS